MNVLTLVAAGLADGSLYGLMALGLVLIYKAQDMVNFAHGEFFMAGAFVGFTCYTTVGLPYPIAFAAAIVAGGLIGAVVERVTIRPLSTQPHVTLAMVSVGLSFTMKGIARIPFGADIYTFPPIIQGPPLAFAGVIISPQSLVIIVVALAVTAALYAIFQFTSIGKQMRAVQQNYTGARIVGIDAGYVFALTWALSAAIGAAAGIMAAPISLLYPDMGATFLLKGFAAAVLGGFGSAPGAIVGGFLIGVIEKLVGGLIDTRLLDVSSYIIIIAVMFVRPQGLFGVPPTNRV